MRQCKSFFWEWWPFQNTISFNITCSTAEKMRIEIYDMLGNTMKTTEVSLISGENLHTVKTEDLTPGVYTYRLMGKRT
ncbi:T9SS C-terminal target domain-containing protein [Mariniphaga sediminis]|uniref:T9SS C-terminal target domain-containing protein n=1 Tax=Mariniphaga sediminis TaxID=1628158 RepID=A0A399CYB0_9BACT|nr:T9SS type A sorting domain-containing protein [Mariniphaga sediminis]RIH64419.1 T9SS C-terminal target domain-containing protein [Mariniphaga sediminis]